MGLLPGLGGLHHVPAAAVVGADREGDAGVAGGLLLGPHNEFLQHRGEAAFVAHHFEAHAVGVHVVHFLLQVGHEQAHEAGNFFLGALPVFCAEGEQAQVRHTQFGAGLDDVTHLLGPSSMPQRCRHEAVLGPATVAIHDDGDVLRHGVAGGGIGQGVGQIWTIADFRGICARAAKWGVVVTDPDA